MTKRKNKKIDIEFNEDQTLHPYVIDLRKKQSETEDEEEKIELNTKPFWGKIKKINLNFSKINLKRKKPNFSLKVSLFNKKKQNQVSLKSFFLAFRNKLIFKKQVNEFSQYVNNVKDSIDKFNLSKISKKSDKESDYVYKINWYRSALSFLLVLILLVIPFKALDYLKLIDMSSLEDRVLVHSQAAIDNLMTATNEASQLNLGEAEKDFSLASKDFQAAQKELAHLQSWLLNIGSLSNNPKIKLAAESKKIVAAGKAGSKLGENFSLAIDSLINQEEKNWLERIDEFDYYSDLALNNLKDLKTNLDSINYKSLPLEYQDQFIAWRDKLVILENSLNSLSQTADEVKEFLGYNYNRRYLLVFQNNTEMRASGGFMGSYALIDFKQGEIDNIEVPAGGTYDTEAGMRSFIRSPRPLWLVNPRWFFWDSNWWPDWPKTARNLMWFYEKSDGPTVDGVISFTPDVLESFLQITGPIYLPKYELTINADNFWSIIQSTVEKENLALSHPEIAKNYPDSPENQPKKIIGDLMEELLEVMPEKIDAQTLPLLLELLEKDWRAKNILLYFNDDNLQNLVKDWGLDGSVKESPHDYLLVTHTNIAGQKSDRKMEEKVFLDTQILKSGRIVNELTIIRKHQGIKNEALTGARNVDWLRVYVPENSRIIEASGFSQPDRKFFEYPETDWEVHPKLAESEELAEIDQDSGLQTYNELDKTVFANWVMTDPGETSVVKIRYELPFSFEEVKRDRNYQDFINHLLDINQKRPAVHSLLVQKQPGLKTTDFFSRLRLPSDWQAHWRYPEDETQKDAWLIKDKLDGDKFWAVLALPKE